MRGSSRLLLISSIFFVFSLDVAASKTHIIYWNASNPLFTSGDYEINVRLGDQIKIVCPQVSPLEDDHGAYLIIHKDSEMAHMNCVLETPRQVAVCNNPHGDTPIATTTTVRKYRMNTFGIEFEPGQTHYFLSTSRGTRDPDGMNKKMEGMCKHDHMRMKIHVDELDPATVVDTTRAPATSTASGHPPSRFSIPMSGGRRNPHEQRRHTKKEKERPLERFSESDMPTLYTYHTASEQAPETAPSGWDAVKMNADEMVGDLRGGYASFPDYIISEQSGSSSAAFSLVLLSMILLITLR